MVLHFFSKNLAKSWEILTIVINRPGTELGFLVANMQLANACTLRNRC